MSKYSGFILSVMLVLICLWINICRYPSVWRMLQGQYEPQVQMGKLNTTDDKSSVKKAVPAKPLESKTDANQTPDKDDEPSQKSKEPRGTIVSDDNANPYQTVSYDGQSESAGQARGPVPVVPRPRGTVSTKTNTDAATSSHTGREEKKNRSQQDAEDDPEDNTLSDRVFRAPTLTRPVSDDMRSGKEAPTPSQNGSIKKNSASGDDTGADESGTSDSPDSDHADGYVSVIEPGKQVQLATQRGGVRLTSGSSSPVYGPVGSKGTIPMNFERPSY